MAQSAASIQKEKQRKKERQEQKDRNKNHEQREEYANKRFERNILGVDHEYAHVKEEQTDLRISVLLEALGLENNDPNLNNARDYVARADFFYDAGKQLASFTHKIFYAAEANRSKSSYLRLSREDVENIIRRDCADPSEFALEPREPDTLTNPLTRPDLFSYEDESPVQPLLKYLGVRPGKRLSFPIIMTGQKTIGLYTDLLERSLRTYERNADKLFDSEIGKIAGDTDFLEQKLDAACQSRRTEIVRINNRLEQLTNSMLGIPDSDDFGLSAEDSEDSTYSLEVDSIVHSISLPITKLESMRIGIPGGFYRDLVEIVTTTDMSTSMFFVKALSKHMTSKDFRLKNVLADKPLLDLKTALAEEPETVLPDPQFIKELKTTAYRLAKLGGGDGAVHALNALHEASHSYSQGLQMLEPLSSDHSTYTTIKELTETHSGELQSQLLDIVCAGPQMIRAYGLLQSLGSSGETTAEFLRDYGNFKIGSISLAEKIWQSRSKPDAVKLIAENALYVCCENCASDILSLALENKGGTKILRQYIRFATTEQPYKQLALIRYTKQTGINGLDKFMKQLDVCSDSAVSCVIDERNFSDFLAGISLFAEQPENKQEEVVHNFQLLINSDLVTKYGLTPDVAELDDSALNRLDYALGLIRDSRYEGILLSVPEFREHLLEKTNTSDFSSMDCLKDLPQTGNPYQALRKAFNLDLEDISICSDAPTAPQPPFKPQYTRIILVSNIIVPETVQYISEQTGLPVQSIAAEASSNKFNAISPKDLVIFDTGCTSHAAYSKVKYLAVSREAAFLHTSHTNRERLLGLVTCNNDRE